MSQRTLVKALRQRLYAERRTDVATFHALIPSLIGRDLTVLDVGCGKGRLHPFPWGQLPGVTLIGLDPDPEAATNPALQRFVLLVDEGTWAIEDCLVDVAISQFVLEHVEEPESFLRNLRRVLRPGGRFAFLTPNAVHPFRFVSGALPHSWKQRILGKTAGVASNDVFPTYYRMNTARRVRELAAASGFDVEQLTTFDSTPTGYLDFSIPGFLACAAYHEVVHRTGLEQFVGISFMGVLRKPFA